MKGAKSARDYKVGLVTLVLNQLVRVIAQNLVISQIQNQVIPNVSFVRGHTMCKNSEGVQVVYYFSCKRFVEISPNDYGRNSFGKSTVISA